MSDLQQVDDRPTLTSVATQVAAAVEADSKPHLETTTHMQLETMAAAHHSVLHQVKGVLVYQVDRECAELSCTHGIGALGVVGHRRFGCCIVCDSAAWRFGSLWGIQVLSLAIRSNQYTIIRSFASIPNIRLPHYFRKSVDLVSTRSPARAPHRQRHVPLTLAAELTATYKQQPLHVLSPHELCHA